MATGSGTPAVARLDSTRQKRSSEMSWNRLPITGIFIADDVAAALAPLAAEHGDQHAMTIKAMAPRTIGQ